MESFLQSFFLVAISEMGDKTQLLAFILVLRFKKPWTIMAGIFFATVLNHYAASSLGGWVAQKISPDTLRYILSGLFVAFAFWILIPDKDDETPLPARYGVFLTTLVAFFLAEMGDKTQLATVALAAKFQAPLLVTAGTTVGMMVADGLAVFWGRKITEKLPLVYIRGFAAFMFLVFGIVILMG